MSSCDKKTKEVSGPMAMASYEIPSIEKNRSDLQFELQNGVLLYENEPYSGIVKEYYSNKVLKSESAYFQGKRQGYFFGWHDNGNKWFERYYSKGIKTRSHVGWYANGQPMFGYEFNDKGSYHGAVKDWHANGVLANWFNYVDGKEDGSQKMWDIDGEIKANFHTVNGERYGLIGLKNCGGSTRILKK